MNDLIGVGGAIVRRTFSMGGERMMSGMVLTREQLALMPKNNRRALVDNRNIELYPDAQTEPGQAFVIHRGWGQFDVVVGHKINDEVLAKQEAYELAGLEMPKD